MFTKRVETSGKSFLHPIYYHSIRTNVDPVQFPVHLELHYTEFAFGFIKDPPNKGNYLRLPLLFMFRTNARGNPGGA